MELVCGTEPQGSPGRHRELWNFGFKPPQQASSHVLCVGVCVVRVCVVRGRYVPRYVWDTGYGIGPRTRVYVCARTRAHVRDGVG